MFVLSLLMLIIHITKHGSTQRCVHENERGLPNSG
jgi:hypothetical protein